MGNESYGEGYDASGLPLGDEFKGIGILYGETDDAPTVRTYLADGQDAETENPTLPFRGAGEGSALRGRPAGAGLPLCVAFGWA